MATTYQTTYTEHSIENNFTLQGMSPYVLALGRILFSLIFIVAGMGHFSQPMVDYGVSMGVPMASILVPLTGALAILGGLFIATGYKARWGAMLVILFLVPVTLIMHSYWTFTEPAVREMQMVHFMKNVALLGAAMYFLYFGSGPVSLDNYFNHRSSNT